MKAEKYTKYKKVRNYKTKPKKCCCLHLSTLLYSDFIAYSG